MQTPIYCTHAVRTYLNYSRRETMISRNYISITNPPPKKKIKVNKGKESKRICLTDFV